MKIKLEPRDIWIGVYWNPENSIGMDGCGESWIRFYVCVVPCIVIIFCGPRRKRNIQAESEKVATPRE